MLFSLAEILNFVQSLSELSGRLRFSYFQKKNHLAQRQGGLDNLRRPSHAPQRVP
jgi:hypothetical protein